MNVSLLDRFAKEEIQGVIKPITLDDLNRIAQSKEFRHFDWLEQSDYTAEIFKLVVSNEILGLIWFHSNYEDHIEIRQLELSYKQRNTKRFDGVAGCLIATACEEALQKYNGKVKLLPQNQHLKRHYIQKYGFVDDDEKVLHCSKSNSEQLLEKYHRK